eukprot:5167168-Alexandrium_andersonii.AAC.1
MRDSQGLFDDCALRVAHGSRVFQDDVGVKVRANALSQAGHQGGSPEEAGGGAKDTKCIAGRPCE